MNHHFFALRRGALLSLSLLLLLVMAACAATEQGGATAGDDNTGGGTVAVTDGVVEISADDLEFNASVIEAPAAEPFTIVLENLEALPHNIAVFTEEGGDLIARGEIINEGETDELSVAALEPGEYFFVCELHFAEMQGTLVVEG